MLKMGLFDKVTGFDADVEKATTERNTDENWSSIMDVCDKVSLNPRNAKDCLRAIMKRMNHNDPHVVMQAITLLNACVSNCGKAFHLEIASRDFENEFKRLLSKAQPQISLKLRQMLKSWSEKDFKQDPELNLIPSLYLKLKQDGYDFTNLNEKPIKSNSLAAEPVTVKDPNVVSSQQEEDDLVRAIELSLQDVKNSPKQSSNLVTNSMQWAKTTSNCSSLYPSCGGNPVGTSKIAASNSSTSTRDTLTLSPNNAETRIVRTLYDFEAAEDNELTFYAGEIVHVIDDTDSNWWKGYNQRGEGLFPSNFVSSNLSINPDSLEINQEHKNRKNDNTFSNGDVQQLTKKPSKELTESSTLFLSTKLTSININEINESKIDRLLHLLHEANPEDCSQDTKEMLDLENEVHQMGPLIDVELERIDRKHAQLSQLSSDLVDAINIYHSLMRVERAVRSDSAAVSAVGGSHSMSNYVAAPLSTSMSYGGMNSLPQFINRTATTETQGGFVDGDISAGYNPIVNMPFNNSVNNSNNILMQYQNDNLGVSMDPGQSQMRVAQSISQRTEPHLQSYQQQSNQHDGINVAVLPSNDPQALQQDLPTNSRSAALLHSRIHEHAMHHPQQNQVFNMLSGQGPYFQNSSHHQQPTNMTEQPSAQSTEITPRVERVVAAPQVSSQLPYMTNMHSSPSSKTSSAISISYGANVSMNHYNHQLQQQQIINTNSPAGHSSSIPQSISTFQQTQP